MNLSGPNGHSITGQNNFAFSDDNTVGTQATGTSYSLCGVLQPDSGTPTISTPANYTTSGPPPPPPGNAPPTFKPKGGKTIAKKKAFSVKR